MRRALKKRVLKSPMMHYIIAFIMSIVVRLIYATARARKIIPDASRPYIAGEKPAIFCFWHGRMVMNLVAKPPNRAMYVLSSQHADGTLIAAIMLWFGIGTVRGSPNRGGARALRRLLEVTHKGGNIAITPDGPRGPFQKAALGAAYIAAKTGYPLVPVTFSATRSWRFGSWDRFMLPKFFTRITFMAGEPLTIESEDDASVRSTTDALEAAITLLTAETDALCGVRS